MDLKSSIAILSKLPVTGDRIVEILLSKRQDSAELHEDGAPTFWLVVADQFERRGIGSARAFERALTAIETGADLRDLRARGMSEPDLRKRSALLAELADRLTNPRPQRPRPQAKKPPSPVVAVGEAYSFPAMMVSSTKCKAINPGSRGRLDPFAMAGSAKGPFKADAWGAMLILGQGRAYDWLPWCAYASLLVPHTTEPTLEDVRRARLLIVDSAQLAVRRRLHLRRMEARLLGRLSLDPDKVASLVKFEPQGFGPEFAVYADWSFNLFGLTAHEGGVLVSQLLTTP